MPETQVFVFKKGDGSVPLRAWLDSLRKKNRRAYAKCLARIKDLAEQGSDLRRPTAAPLRNGIHELRPKVGNLQFRILYFFHGRDVAVLSHGLQKEGAVPDQEIDKAIENKELVEKNPDKYTQEWEFEV